MEKQSVKPADGKLGIMVVGLGAVTSTFMTGKTCRFNDSV